MSFTVTMPQLGETVIEGTVLRWAKQVGDVVGEDDILLEISTDKVDAEVPSPFAGTLLEILVPEGETVGVGTHLAIIGEPGEVVVPGSKVIAAVIEAISPEPIPEAPSAPSPLPAAVLEPTVAVTQQGDTGGVLSPVVRRLVAEHGIDPGAIVGSGRGGRITRRDVEAFVASVAPATPSAVPRVLSTETVEPIDRLRHRIATNMISAKQTAAHVFTSVEVDFELVERVRRQHRDAFKEREGFSLTYLPFISRATVDALTAFPVVNSSFDLEAGTRTFHANVNLGIGVDLGQGGLVVTTVRGADGLRLRDIGREVRRLADKVLAGNMESDDLAGSTFTITNAGLFGSFLSVPIINLPNVAILSTDGIKKRPVVISDEDGNDAIAIRHVGYLGLTWDHRAFDGSTAVLFLQRIRESLETWGWEQELA